jgi:hypothetical protein
MTKAPQEEFEGLARQLIGRELQHVTYYEIDYGPEQTEPMWARESPRYDSLDHGLTLHLDNGDLFSLIWGWEFTQYGVWLIHGPLTLGAGARCWPADERWARALGKRIADTRVYWLPADAPGCPLYPQDVAIHFSNDVIVTVSAFESRGPGFHCGMMDNITVFFDEEDLRRFGLAQFGSPR